MPSPNIFPTEVALSADATRKHWCISLFDDAVVLVIAGIYLACGGACDLCSHVRGIFAIRGSTRDLKIEHLVRCQQKKRNMHQTNVFPSANQNRPLLPRNPKQGSGSADCAELQARVIELETVVAEYAQCYGLTESARRAMASRR